jgi:hypothetical protein
MSRATLIPELYFKEIYLSKCVFRLSHPVEQTSFSEFEQVKPFATAVEEFLSDVSSGPEPYRL